VPGEGRELPRTGEDSVNIVNLPNAGQVRDLPLGSVVETYGALNGAGVFGELPHLWPR
jgi:alpha-galactosidase/6-phospho-beta-glucosidase family protein